MASSLEEPLIRLVLKDVLVPTVIRKRDVCEKWPIIDKSLEEWAQLLGSETKLTFRIHNLTSGCTFENKFEAKLEATFHQFVDWTRGQCTNSSPFLNFHRNQYFAYSSYNYMNQTFDSSLHRHLFQSLNWTSLGFERSEKGPEICDASDSTLWIGSDKAFTPCHQDTYGFNLVAQLYGRKRWVLFPPTDTQAMYPTRIPFEESSVFSSVDFSRPNLNRMSKFEHAHPRMVILEPGDLLIVPNKWWHHVTCMSDQKDEDRVAISANIWLPVAGHDAHLEEAVARFLASALIPCYEPLTCNWINDEKEKLNADEAVTGLQLIARQVKEDKASGFNSHENGLTIQLHSNEITVVPQITFQQLAQELDWPSVSASGGDNRDDGDDVAVEERLVNWVLNEQVIKLICHKILEH